MIFEIGVLIDSAGRYLGIIYILYYDIYLGIIYFDLLQKPTASSGWGRDTVREDVNPLTVQLQKSHISSLTQQRTICFFFLFCMTSQICRILTTRLRYILNN